MKAFSPQHRAALYPAKQNCKTPLWSLTTEISKRSLRKYYALYFLGMTDEKIFRNIPILGIILRFMLLAKIVSLLNICDIIQYSIFTAVLHNDNHL